MSDRFSHTSLQEVSLTARHTPDSPPEWLGLGTLDEEPVGTPARFAGGKLWIGAHSADGDLLVFAS